MGPAGILLHLRTKRFVLQADRTQIGRNHLASRDCLRGRTPIYSRNYICKQRKLREL